MQPIRFDLIRTERLLLPLFTEKKLEAAMLRLDTMHPLVSGNKWFKLRYHLETAKKNACTTVVTWGGAWSNHILATAAASRLYQFRSVGLIRGEEPATLSASLVQAREMGMELVFLNRSDYGKQLLPGAYSGPEYHIIPEGGYGPAGAAGAAGILDYCDKTAYTHFCCAAGTGTMAAGLAQAAPEPRVVLAVSVLKNHTALEQNIRALCNNPVHLQVVHDFHMGGYAKKQTALIDCMNDFYRQTGIPLDFVYTGKLVYAVTELARMDFFPPGSKLLLIHSGGLPGNRSLNKGTLIF